MRNVVLSVCLVASATLCGAGNGSEGVVLFGSQRTYSFPGHREKFPYQRQPCLVRSVLSVRHYTAESQAAEQPAGPARGSESQFRKEEVSGTPGAQIQPSAHY